MSTTTANPEQFEAWNGESGHRWVASAERRDAVLGPVARLILDQAAIGPGERVLDVGCGCGVTTIAAAVAADNDANGEAVGADLSAPMLEVARTRAADQAVENVAFTQADVQTAQLEGPFDVAISRFGTMFFADPHAAFANVAGSLATGGRLVIATWQPLTANQWLVVPGAALLKFGDPPDGGESEGPGMFAQSDPAKIRAMLEAAGFSGIHSEPDTVSLTFGSSIDEAVDYLSNSGPGRAILQTIPDDRYDDALAAVHAALAPHHDPARGVVLDAGVWITTATRR